MLFVVVFFVLISAVVYWYLVPHRYRSLFLLACSLLCIGTLNPIYPVWFVLHVAVVYWVGLRLRHASKRRTLWLQIALVWLIGNLCFFKYTTTILETLVHGNMQMSGTPGVTIPTILLPLGISYITFRLIHYIVEVYRDNAPRSSFVDVAVYVLFFPTYLAGPVERFPRFHAQTQAISGVALSDVNYGMFRILKGLIKKTLIADQLATLVLPILHAPTDYARAVVFCAVYGAAIQIYMDFSGYTDMAIGTARLFGYRIMENFNAPFLKHNIVLFLRSWHISVYTWIRDYFFFPLFGYRTSRLKLYLGILCTMMVFHLWHRASLAFFVLGLYYSFGVIAWHVFQGIKRRMPHVQAALEHRFLKPLSIFATFTFVSIGPLVVLVDSNAFDVLLRLTHG